MSRALAALVLATLLALTAACGGDSGKAKASSEPPTDASKTTFCAGLKKINADKDFASVKKDVVALKKIGTPTAIPKDARQGFLELVDYTAAATDQKALASKVTALTGDAKAHLTSLSTYLTKTCGS